MGPEAKIEAAVGRYAKSHHIRFDKNSSPGRRGVCDRHLIAWNGVHAYIEFKVPKGKLTSNQSRDIDDLTRRGVPVYIVRSIEAGKDVVDTILSRAGVRGDW